MTHLGDITKIHGGEIESVDCITFGSPCQDLSVAGKGAGLAGERSGLFMEAVRIIREMRAATNGKHPTIAAWENVPGALSSNKGEDFRAVLEELARCAEPGAAVPGPPGGKWRPAGCIVGDGWSIAWRVHDAQFWGVPQRRRRIALVLDFGGHRASEILFERQGVPGHFGTGCWAWQASAGRFVQCADLPSGASAQDTGLGADGVGAPCMLRMRAGCEGGGKGPLVQEDVSGTLAAHNDQYLFRPVGVYENHQQDGRIKDLGDVCCTVAAKFGMGGNNQPVVVHAFSAGQGKKAGSIGYAEELAPTLRSADTGTNRAPCICIQGNTIDRAAHQNGLGVQEELAYTLDAADRHAVCFAQKRFGEYAEGVSSLMASPAARHEKNLVCTSYCLDTRNVTADADTWQTLQAGSAKSSNAMGVLAQKIKAQILWFVRRLTPTECARLQGYPDGWCDIPPTIVNGKLVKYSDSAAYKAYGNSIALPFWAWMMERMAQYLPSGATLGSLFDGIGGFPLVWERIHGQSTARWASEIEPFCVAVTMHRFSEG